MGSGYYGELNLGNSERASGSSSSPSSSSSRKGKKNSSEKPKQPQRGLGVAQLEKIRLHGQLDSSGFPLHNHHHQVPTYPSSTFNNVISLYISFSLLREFVLLFSIYIGVLIGFS